MKGMTLEAMAKACRGTLVGGNAMQFLEAEGIVIDSRKVQDNFVFVALKGERADGHQFIDQVFEEGALAVICEQELNVPKGPYIRVESTYQALKDLAAYYRSVLDIRVVGISGSVGKTSTKEMVASVLSQKYKVHKTEGNFNNEIGLPLTIFKIREEHEVAVLEMGISEFNEMHRLAAVSRPDIAVITNIGLCHLENLKTRDGILRAKTEMFDHLQGQADIVLNGDDDKLCTISEVMGKKPVFYGIGKEKPEEAVYERKSLYASHLEEMGLKGVRMKICMDGSSFTAVVPIPGRHNVYNALAAAAVGKCLGLTSEEIKAGIESVHMIDGRTNLIEVNGKIIIDDCYNANPVSMKASLDVLATAKGRTIAVLGDMGELGENEGVMHYGVGVHLAKQNIQVLFCVGTLAQEIARGAKEYAGSAVEIHTFATRDAMLKSLLPYLKVGDAVLVKASHFMGFQEVVEQIITT